MLDIRHLFKSYPVEGGLLRRRVASVLALRDVSLTLNKSETLAIVGGSGCGKSTLARIIAGLLAPDSGEVLWEGTALSGLSRIDRARRIQMIFQDPYASLNPKLSVGTQLAEVVRLVSSPLVGEDEGGGGSKKARNPPSQPSPTRGEGVLKRCIELLNAVGLPADVLPHYPFQFSGGQRQHIAIARALAMEPELLIADEPLSALDVTTQARMLALFGQLKASLGLTLLFITHDLAVAEEFADRVVVLHDGQVVEEGPAAIVLRTPKRPYTLALLEAVPKVLC
jgi:ABC-type glutathione transport system ATPase component